MKKLLILLCALLGLGFSGAWAQTVTATLMEGYGDPLTLDQFKALAGTAGRFGFVASSNTASATSPRCDHWCKFTSVHNTTTLDEDALFYLEASGGNYKVKRSSDGLYVNTSTSSTSFGEGGTAFKLVNRDANDATKAVTGDQSISFEDPSDASMHYNANAVKYNNGAGAWTTYAVFGPIYKVTINCKNENDEVIMTKSCFAKDGTTVNAPEIEGMVLQGNASVTVNGADATFDATYQDNRITVLYSTSTGTFTTTGNFVHEWNSTATDPQVTFAVSGGANNIASSTGYIYSGANGCTYVLTAQNGYLITGYEIVGTAQTAAQTLTPAAGGSATEFSTEGTTTLRVTGLSVQSTSFTQSTPNNGIAISSFKIFLEEVTTTATYVISHGSGVVYTSAPLPATPGETVTTLPSALQRDFCTYNVTPAEIVAGENTTVNVTVTYNMPFEISPSYDNAKWYYLKLKDATYVTYSSSGTPNVTLPSSYTMGDANAQWAFIGDAYNGFSIVNKAGGNASVLGSASPKNDGNTGANTYATLGSGRAYEKYFPKSSNHVSNGFYLFTSEGYAMNQRSTDNLAYWTGGYDKGSTFSVIEVVDDYSGDVANEITPWFTSYGNYFQLKASVVEANQDTYEAALVQCNLATFNELKALIDDAANYVYPPTGNYRIKSSGSRIGESYIGYGQPSSASAGLITVKAENAITDASTIITLTGADGAYTISTLGKYAKNQTSNNVAFPMTDNAEEAATFHFIPYTPGVVVITNDYSTQGYFHESNWAIPGVVRWTAASTASHWTIEELPAVTVDVTYELYVGGEKVNTVVAEAIAANSAVSIPAALTAGYSSDYYTFTPNGTIGEENCTITVTGALTFIDVVYPYTNISNNKSYYIKTRNGERDALSTYTNTENGITYLASPVKQALGIAPKPFAILNYEGNYYLYSVEDKKFVTYSAEQAAPLADVITGTSDRVTFSPTLAPLYELRFDGSSSKIINSSSSYTYGIIINGWGGTSSQWDDGCQYSIDEAEDFDPTEALAVLEEFFHPSYTVTYVVKDADDNTLFTSDPVGTTLGATITELPAEYKMDAFYTYNTVDLTVSDLNTTASFIATPKENPLVKYTADATSPVWYKLKLKDANYPTYVANVAEGEYNVQTPTTANDDATTYQWAFIGEPYAGFQMINRAAGTSLVLGSATTIGIGDTGASVKATLAAPGTQARELWYLSPSSHLSGGFFLYNADGHALNQRGPGFLAYWTAGADLGSTFTVTEVHEGEALFNDLIAQLEAYPYGAGVNQYSMIVEGNNYTSQASGIISNLETAGCTDETLATAQLLIDGTTLNLPKAGFYRIKGYSGNYITSNTAGSNAAMNGTASANNIVYYSAEKNLVFFGSGYGLYNTSIVAPAGSTLNTYEFMQGAQIGKYYVKSNASGMGTYCYDNTANGTKVDRNGAPVTSGDFQTDWTLEEVTTLPIVLNGPVDGSYYATFCVPFNVTLEGVTAYTLTKEGTTLNMSEGFTSVTGGTPVMLKGTNASATATITPGEPAEIRNGTLTGTYEAISFDGNANYVLGTDGTKVGFFHWEGTELKGCRAYIAGEAVSVGGEVKGFYLNNDITTQIREMVDANSKATYYDLSGRKVSKPVRGLYIVNGKKVAVK